MTSQVVTVFLNPNKDNGHNVFATLHSMTNNLLHRYIFMFMQSILYFHTNNVSIFYSPFTKSIRTFRTWFPVRWIRRYSRKSGKLTKNVLQNNYSTKVWNFQNSCASGCFKYHQLFIFWKIRHLKQPWLEFGGNEWEVQYKLTLSSASVFAMLTQPVHYCVTPRVVFLLFSKISFLGICVGIDCTNNYHARLNTRHSSTFILKTGAFKCISTITTIRTIYLLLTKT